MKILCKEDAQEAIEEISRWLFEHDDKTELAEKWSRELLDAAGAFDSQEWCPICGG